jgi:hypothetical protein
MERAISPYSKAKSERVYLENFLRCKKAILMNQCNEKTAVAKEQYAYSHGEYIKLLEGLKAAVEIEEKCRWSLERLKIECDLFRTCQANDRYIKNSL